MSSSEREFEIYMSDDPLAPHAPPGPDRDAYLRVWQAARRAQASAEPVARMEVLNHGAVTYGITAAAERLPPGEYLLYARGITAAKESNDA